MLRSLLLTLPLLGGFRLVLAQQTCNATVHCGAAAPCCSEYGFCGTDSFCLGGCNPQFSNTWDACRPAPICRDAVHTFKDNSRIVNHTLYDGNATQYDFTLDSGSLYNLNTSSELALLLTEKNGGTRISSTRYLQYGTVTTRLKTTKWAGVVTAAITMSDVKDEIDWEWPGAQTLQAQSNYFWLGQVNYPPTSGKTETVSNDSYSNYHDYTVDWQEDELNFSIDGKNVRTIKKSDTIDSSGRAQYPTTPARIQVSVWPAGINTSAEGTVKWAGGMINWNDPDYSAAGGHFAAVLQSVTIKCGSSSNTSLPSTPRSYVYAGNNSQGIPVAYISNATTLLNGAMGRVKVGAGVWSATCVGLVGVAIGMLLSA